MLFIRSLILFVLINCSLLTYATASDRMLLVDKASQSFYYFEYGEKIRTGSISTGRKSHWTPVGRFTVGHKNKDHRSKLYNDVPMPFAMQINGNIFIHQGRLPGYPASKGCVRLGNVDAEYLFGRMKAGDVVVIQ